MTINVKTNKRTSEQLTALSKKRKADLSLIKTKQDIVADLVDRAYKKECNNER